MAKTNTLQARVLAQAKALSREPIMDALANAVRKAAPKSVSDVGQGGWTKAQSPTPARVVAAQPKVRRARASRVGFRRYKVTWNGAELQHKRGTWTRFMVATITDHTDTRIATKAHKDSTQYPEKTLDFNWCVKQGYIAYE